MKGTSHVVKHVLLSHWVTRWLVSWSIMEFGEYTYLNGKCTVKPTWLKVDLSDRFTKLCLLGIINII